MTSRELVLSTLEFDSPERVPRHVWLLPWAEFNYPEMVEKIRRDFPDDFITSPNFYKESLKTTGDKHGIGNYTDEWGCVFEKKERGVIGEVKNPVLKNWVDVDKIRIPVERLSRDREQINAFCRSSDKFVLSECGPRPFEQLQFIRGSENLLMDLIDQPEELFILLRKMHQFYLDEMEVWARTDVNGLMFMDDWGAQNSVLISPRLFRNIFKPLYKEYAELAHHYDKYLFMHSDGYITDIIPDLIEIGIDALNAQLFCMDIEELGRQFSGKITFWGEIDRQYVLARGTKEEVIDAVKRVHYSLYRNGGVIAQCEFGAGSNPENVYLVFETWDKLI